jgi:RES domain-containing protein
MMTPLPAFTASGKPAEIVAWRLDREKHRTTWDSGEGARLGGGRWNSKGRRAVYCSLDPATTILEVAVNRTFKVLDTEPHVLTAVSIKNPADIKVVKPEDVPNPNWLVPGTKSVGQQAFGDNLLATHGIIIIPSVVSRSSWNLVFDRDVATGRFAQLHQEAFALDPRLHSAH